MSEKKDAELLWAKAMEDRRAAFALREITFSGMVNRAYYAVFHAVGALFFMEGKKDFYKKHRATEAAVHRDLVSAGRWDKEIGAAFTSLYELRLAGDYGIEFEISGDEAKTALESMECILRAVGDIYPDMFTFDEG